MTLRFACLLLTLASATVQPPTAVAGDSIEAIQAEFRAEEAKPILRRSAEVYVALLSRIDAMFFDTASNNRAKLDAFRREVVAAHSRVEEANISADVREEQARRRREEQRREEARAKAIQQKQWPADITKAVIARKIRTGMTTEQVKEAWGKPEKINETITRFGRHEQWVYGIGQYLYFEDGRLTAIQQSR
jgi:hypothetical protein